MRKPNLIFALTLVLTIALAACKSNKLNENPTKTLELKYELTNGNNGMAVAYNPKKKLYYAVSGGNESYPLGVFGGKGERVAGNRANADFRGLWWNTELNRLEGNTYRRSNKPTILSVTIDDKGYFTGENITVTEKNIQPNIQACGVYDFKNKLILFYSYGKVYKVKRSSLEKIGNIKLELPVDEDNISPYSIIYTGFPKKDVGVFDFENKKVYLFDSNTGQHTFTVNLPSESKTYSTFNFSYANGYVWLYNKDTKTWTGHKIN